MTLGSSILISSLLLLGCGKSSSDPSAPAPNTASPKAAMAAAGHEPAAHQDESQAIIDEVSKDLAPDPVSAAELRKRAEAVCKHIRDDCGEPASRADCIEEWERQMKGFEYALQLSECVAASTCESIHQGAPSGCQTVTTSLGEIQQRSHEAIVDLTGNKGTGGARHDVTDETDKKL